MTWTPTGIATGQPWDSVASSADGTKLVAAACDWGSSSGYVYISEDSGASWTQQAGSEAQCWTSVASSADGNRLIAGGSPRYLYTSSRLMP